MQPTKAIALQTIEDEFSAREARFGQEHYSPEQWAIRFTEAAGVFAQGIRQCDEGQFSAKRLDDWLWTYAARLGGLATACVEHLERQRRQRDGR